MAEGIHSEDDLRRLMRQHAAERPITEILRDQKLVRTLELAVDHPEHLDADEWQLLEEETALGDLDATA